MPRIRPEDGTNTCSSERPKRATPLPPPRRKRKRAASDPHALERHRAAVPLLPHLAERESPHCLLRDPVAAKRRSVSPSSARDEPSVLRFRSASSRSILVTWVVGPVCSARLEEERKTSICLCFCPLLLVDAVSAGGLTGGRRHDVARDPDGFELPVLTDQGSLREPSFRAGADGRPPRVRDRCPSPAGGPEPRQWTRSAAGPKRQRNMAALVGSLPPRRIRARP